MKKFFFCVSLALAGLMTSCIEKYEEVDADAKPSWLGGSIYAELKNPDPSRLSGTFSTYLRLVDDLGYAETLNRTGSKTVFPANDEAFQRFFSSNDWGVSSYEQLSDAQKKLLLYTSMLDNALLLGMLPNASNGTSDPMKGAAVKHATNVSVIDSIQFIPQGSGMPQGNPYWEKYYDKGINVVSDNTKPMMVHLTREYMLNNDITTLGDQSDFAILTGSPYTEGTAYIFNNRVVNGDVTCQNGYVHQMEDVLVPPGNMAQVLRRHPSTSFYSRILDHYAVPYFDETTTRQYNDWAVTNGKPAIDSIYQLRYLSTRSQGGNALTRDPNGSEKSSTYVLNLDPGWNQYYPNVAQASNVDNVIRDIAAFFVPDDEAVKKYFLPGGGGSHLIEIYGSTREGSVTNDEAHLMENLDSLHAKKPEVLASFTRNLLKPRFTQTVPSKFPNVTNDASENMGLTLDIIDRKSDGKYDITIANNGVIYVINDMIVPDEYRAVLAPASEYPDMRVMNWAIQDGHSNGDYLGVDFKYYLMAMSANYAFFIPEDPAFDLYYIDPTSLAHENNGEPAPEVLHFYFDTEAKRQPYVKCTRYRYNPETGEVDLENPRDANISAVKTQLVDILNYHTLILKSGETIGQNHYYKTKHGGEVYVDGNIEDGRVMSGAQIENPDLLPAPRIKKIYNEKNGHAYRLDRVIQPPHKSVYAVLMESENFTEFMEACTGFQATDLMTWAGISADINKATGASEQDAFTIFTSNYKLGSTTINDACLDYNVKMFNTYNYTLFAPDNKAMEIAYQNGLPRWSEILALFEKYHQEDQDETEESSEISAEEQQDMDRAKAMIKCIRDFVRYHFVTSSVYADNEVAGGDFQSLSSDATGVAKEVSISGGNGKITVTDLKGHSVTVDAANTNMLVNKMARDYWFNAAKKTATAIETSSFCAVHQISEPLYNNASGRFDQ
ncbi:MAG: fasciclin domain-containing protein [Prevotella sp.]|nr:fasciclin domain-containing protein [Prevotella sp.]